MFFSLVIKDGRHDVLQAVLCGSAKGENLRAGTLEHKVQGELKVRAASTSTTHQHFL
jgi:hypothetical protein